MHRPAPLGLYHELPPLDGVAANAGRRNPGPLGIFTNPRGDWPAVVIDLAIRESIGRPFAVGAETYCLHQTDTAWLPRSNEEPVPPPEAEAIIERAAVQHRENVPLFRLLEIAALQLTGLHRNGTFVLVRVRPQSTFGEIEPSPPAQPPAPAPRPAPSPEQPAAVEEPVMPAAVAAAQAATLKKAAASGVPFCEECTRAAARQTSTLTTRSLPTPTVPEEGGGLAGHPG